MSRKERREHLNSARYRAMVKKEKEAKGNRKGQKIKKFVTLFLLTGALGTYVSLSSLNVNDAKNANIIAALNKPKPSATPNASAPTDTVSGASKQTYANYDQVDALAILGVLAIARQVPESQSALVLFVSQLKKAKNNPTQTAIDMGVKGNDLTDYVLSPKGLTAPACFAIAPATVAGEYAKQKDWVLYIEPKSKKFSALVLLGQGITNCQQAAIAASQMPNNTRDKISTISRNVINSAILTVPSYMLTKEGNFLFDEARGFTP